MIVQVAPDGKTAFVIKQQDHAEVSGIFAEHFGNDDFELLNPRDALIHVARHHDDGWESIDAKPELDPKTGFVYHLTQTPMRKLIESGNKSPDSNEAYNSYSGIISSMHTYGLYHGRYGLSDKIVIDLIGDEWREQVQAMLDQEFTRQKRIKEELRADEQGELVEDRVLFRNYKLLQFFDTLALYIQTAHPENVGEAEFIHVPKTLDDDVTIQAKVESTGVITLSPWSFDVDNFEVNTKGRIMSASISNKTLATAFAESPISEQSYTFKKA